MLDELTKQNANSTRFAIFLEHENQRSERCGFRQCVQNWNNTDLQNYKLDLISYKSGVFTEISEIFITKKAHVFYIWPKLAK